MLFCIDDSVLDFLNDSEVIISLNNLGNIRREGHHVIYAKKNVLETLYKCEKLDTIPRSVYRKIFYSSINLQNYFNNLNRKIILVGKKNIFKREEENGEINIIISINEFCSLETLTKSYLLLEDYEDSYLYKYIANYYIKNSKFEDDLTIKFNVLNGGGHRICYNFKEYTRDNDKLLLSLVDTDKLSPMCNVGGTCSDIKKYYEENKYNLIAELLINERYHELENLMPINCYKEVYNLRRGFNNIHKESAVTGTSEVVNGYKWNEFACKIIEKNRNDVWNYFDFKDGLKYKKIKDNKYWKDLFESIDIDIEDFKDCEDKVIVEGFGSKILGFTFEELKKVENITVILPEYLKEIWLELGQVIISWCCNGRVFSGY